MTVYVSHMTNPEAMLCACSLLCRGYCLIDRIKYPQLLFLAR